MKKEWKFEPDPLTRGYIEFLDKSPIEFDKATELIIEKNEIDEDKSEVTVDFVFVPKNCPKKMRVTFDYNEITNRINCKKTTLQN